MSKKVKQWILTMLTAGMLLLAFGCTRQPETEKPAETPMPAVTSTPTISPTPTLTPTPTLSPTPTNSPTPTPFPADTAQVETHTIDELKSMPETNFPGFSKQITERPLLVLLMDYRNSELEYTEEAEKAWSDYIFGTGTMEDGTASVNDYFMEVSGGKFRFAPVLLGDNTTGVYTFHLDKKYTDAQGLHSEYPFFEFNYDTAKCISKLAKQGLNLDDFACKGINKKNYVKILMEYFDWTANGRESGYYETGGLLCVFPNYNWEKVDFTPISDKFDKYTLYAHINETSSFGTICHELTHLMGAYDIYQYGNYYNDLMAAGANIREAEYNVTHVNPYYNLLYGWCDADVWKGDGTYRLYAAETGEYRPLLIPTEDPNQYFLIEYRTAKGFDTELMYSYDYPAGNGVTVWRVDQTAMNKKREAEETRMGVSMEGVFQNPGQTYFLRYYADFKNPKVLDMKEAGLQVTVKSVDEAGTAVIEVKGY